MEGNVNISYNEWKVLHNAPNKIFVTKCEIIP